MAAIKVAAAVAACLLGVVVAFQLALAAGASWGAMAYGGRAARDDGRLPTRYRIASAVAALVLAGAGWVILAAGAVLGPGPMTDDVLAVGTWVLVGLLALSTAANLAGRHPLERWGAGGLTAVLTVLCAVVALGR